MSSILYENGYPVLAIVNGKIVKVQEVKHGRWESVPYGCVCSVCGKRKEQGSDNFCANCGAKMVNEDD